MARATLEVPPLYAILDDDAARGAGWTVVDLASEYVDGGARFLQVRAKHVGSAEFVDLVGAVRDRVAGSGATLVVNDRADVARLTGADGVHVGQDDLGPALVRRVVGPDAIVGLSTHTVEQIDPGVTEPVCYIAVGPVFNTASKATGYDAVGLGRVRYAADRAAEHGLAVVAIGGVTLDTAQQVLDAGAMAVAVIGDLLATGDPRGRVRAYVERLYNRGVRG